MCSARKKSIFSSWMCLQNYVNISCHFNEFFPVHTTMNSEQCIFWYRSILFIKCSKIYAKPFPKSINTNPEYQFNVVFLTKKKKSTREKRKRWLLIQGKNIKNFFIKIQIWSCRLNMRRRVNNWTMFGCEAEGRSEVVSCMYVCVCVALNNIKITV